MKTKKIRIRQGFTIVELVIVIGVIGVLSAVLIPTFINLNNKANEAADRSLITNLNTQLRMKEQSEGKNKTLTGALADALEAGYKVENLTPKSGKDIVWNQDKDEFFQLESAPDGDAYKYWKIYERAEDIPSTQTYSIYAKGAAWTTVPTLTVGFDAGENLAIPTLNFETTLARSVIIRTNGTGTKLTVNAKNATVNHYDVLDGLTVTAIADKSYHEWGTINTKAVISAGHIEVEDGAKVPEVSVENATAAVKVTANESTLVTADTASSAQTSVVANSSEVYVSGVSSGKISGGKASEVKLPTVVTSETELTAAVAAKKEYLQLGGNFAVDNSIALNYKALLDFAGHTITASEGTTQAEYLAAIQNETPGFVYNNKPLLVNNSNLIVTDTIGNGGVNSSNNIIIDNNSELTINGGSFTSTLQIHKYFSSRGTYDETKAPSTWELTNDQNEYRRALNSTVLRGVIRNEANGTLVINDAVVNVTSDYGIQSYGKTTINGGVFASTSNSSNGGYGYCVTCTDGKMLINKATITGIHGGLSGVGGEMTVENVTVTMDAVNKRAYYALYCAGEVGFPRVTINGGTFNGSKNGCTYIGNANDGGEGNFAMCTFNDGTFNGAIKVSTPTSTYGVGQLVVNGGRYTDSTISTRMGVDHVTQEGDYYVVNK